MTSRAQDDVGSVGSSGVASGKRAIERAWIIADLHLDGSEHRRRSFERVLTEARREAVPLFILGDLFHYWFGRKHFRLEMFSRELEALRAAAAEIPIEILPGNRDFLIDQTFARATQITVHPDAIELQLGGLPVHLSHGDLFCTSDLPYLAMRRLIRSWPIRALAHGLPTRWVDRIASKLRRHSESVVSQKSLEMLEPDRNEVAALIQRGFAAVICGHFHRYRHENFDEAWGRGEFFILEPYETNGYVLERNSSGWREIRLESPGETPS